MDIIRKSETKIGFLALRNETIIEKAVTETELFLREKFTSGYYDILLVLSEILVNAITDNNSSERGSQIACDIEMVASDSFRIDIYCEHSRIDPAAPDFESASKPFYLKSYSYKLIHAIADRVELSSHEKRMSVYLGIKPIGFSLA